jgi:transcriptional regulator with XRE-family HTH domain
MPKWVASWQGDQHFDRTKLRYWLKKRDIGSIDLVGLMGLKSHNQSSINRYINGDRVPSEDTVHRMAEALRVNFEDLCGTRMECVQSEARFREWRESGMCSLVEWYEAQPKSGKASNAGRLFDQAKVMRILSERRQPLIIDSLSASDWSARLCVPIELVASESDELRAGRLLLQEWFDDGRPEPFHVWARLGKSDRRLMRTEAARLIGGE